MKTPIFNLEHKDILQKFTNYLTLENTTKIIDQILISTKYIDYNLNINLLVENIFTRISVLNSSEMQEYYPFCNSDKNV